MLTVNDAVLVQDEQMAEAVYEHFSNILGTSGDLTNTINFGELNLQTEHNAILDHCFSEEEVWQAINDMPVDKAPGPDGFNGMFYRVAWPIIKSDIMRAFHAIWTLDGRSFYLVNQAYMVLLRKKKEACRGLLQANKLNTQLCKTPHKSVSSALSTIDEQPCQAQPKCLHPDQTYS